MIPVFNAFDFFQDLLVLMVVLLPLVAIVRTGGFRQALFILSGLYLLFLIAPRLALFHLVLWAAVALVQPVVSATGERRGGLWVLFAALAVPIVPLVAWKVWPIAFVVDLNVATNEVIRRLSSWLTVVDLSAPIIGPIGLSFSAFRAADMLVKSNLGLVPRLGPGRVLGYGLFAPTLVVGPIATYDEVSATLDARVPIDRPRLLDGALHLMSGITKLWVLAYPLAWSADVFAAAPHNALWRVWVALVVYGWYFYLNFAGYSDLAVGAGRLLGADLKENFAWPYLQTTPNDFWNSWHISLTRFLRINVFTPLTMSRQGRQRFGIMLTMLLIGLWHGVNTAAIAFGLYHGLTLVGHRWLVGVRPPAEAPPLGLRIIKSVGIFFWFTLSLPLLTLSLGDAAQFYRTLVLGAA